MYELWVDGRRRVVRREPTVAEMFEHIRRQMALGRGLGSIEFCWRRLVF